MCVCVCASVQHISLNTSFVFIHCCEVGLRATNDHVGVFAYFSFCTITMDILSPFFFFHPETSCFLCAATRLCCFYGCSGIRGLIVDSCTDKFRASKSKQWKGQHELDHFQHQRSCSTATACREHTNLFATTAMIMKLQQATNCSL